MNSCNRYNLHFLDVNTISDLSDNLKKIFYLPSNFTMDLIQEEFSGFYYFMEFDCKSGSGFFGFLVSLSFWCLLFLAVSRLFSEQVVTESYKEEMRKKKGY